MSCPQTLARSASDGPCCAVSRDLAGNWNIDIASELEEYVDDLQGISIDFVDGETNLNFAEAALLIQGSACIYSKKVEFLHALVFKTLELLATRK